MSLYTFNEPPKLKLSERLGNSVSRFIARKAPEHLEKLASRANKDTHKENYMHEVLGGVHRAVDIHRKKKAIKKLYNYLDNKDLSKINRKFQNFTHGMSIPQLMAMKKGLREAYEKAGKDD